MPTVSTTSRANGAATGAHNPASPGLRPGTSLQAVLAARAGATPAGRPGAAAAGVTPSPAATGGASVGTNDGGTAPEEGTAVAAVLDGAAMQMDDLVAAVMAANRAVLAPAADLYEYLVDGSQKIIVVVAEDSTSPEALLLHSISSVSTTGDIVAMVGEIEEGGMATLVRMTEAAYKPRQMVTLSKVAYEVKIAEGGTADDTFVPRLRRSATDYVEWTAAPMAIIPAGLIGQHVGESFTVAGLYRLLLERINALIPDDVQRQSFMPMLKQLRALGTSSKCTVDVTAAAVELPLFDWTANKRDANMVRGNLLSKYGLDVPSRRSLGEQHSSPPRHPSPTRETAE